MKRGWISQGADPAGQRTPIFPRVTEAEERPPVRSAGLCSEVSAFAGHRARGGRPGGVAKHPVGGAETGSVRVASCDRPFWASAQRDRGRWRSVFRRSRSGQRQRLLQGRSVWASSMHGDALTTAGRIAADRSVFPTSRFGSADRPVRYPFLVRRRPPDDELLISRPTSANGSGSTSKETASFAGIGKYFRRRAILQVADHTADVRTKNRSTGRIRQSSVQNAAHLGTVCQIVASIRCRRPSSPNEPADRPEPPRRD